MAFLLAAIDDSCCLFRRLCCSFLLIRLWSGIGGGVEAHFIGQAAQSRMDSLCIAEPLCRQKAHHAGIVRIGGMGVGGINIGAVTILCAKQVFQGGPGFDIELTPLVSDRPEILRSLAAGNDLYLRCSLAASQVPQSLKVAIHGAA